MEAACNGRCLRLGVSGIAGDTAGIAAVFRAAYRSGKRAVFNRARLHLTHNAAHIIARGGHAALHLQIFDGGAVDPPEQALIRCAAVDGQSADGVAVSVKGAGISAADIPIGRGKGLPRFLLQIDVRRQFCAQPGVQVLSIIRRPSCDQVPKRLQIRCVCNQVRFSRRPAALQRAFCRPGRSGKQSQHQGQGQQKAQASVFALFHIFSPFFQKRRLPLCPLFAAKSRGREKNLCRGRLFHGHFRVC